MKRPELVATTSFVYDPADPLEGTDYIGLDHVASVGIADIYEAVHRERRTLVSVKLLRKDFLEVPGAYTSMRLEAALLANLQHPGIVEALASDRTPSGRPYLVLERIVGRTLGAELELRGHFSADEVADIGRHILVALDVLHTRGIVHRGISLETVVLTSSGTTKLVDLTEAKPLGAGGLSFPHLDLATPVDVSVRLSPFAAPEEVTGRPAGPSSDIFAVGVVLYALLAGHLPSGAASAGDPHPKEVGPAASEILATIRRAMARDPGERFASAVDFCEALEAAASHSGVRRLEFLPTEPSVPAFAHIEALRTDPVPSASSRAPAIPPFSPEQFRPRIPSSTFRKLAVLRPTRGTSISVAFASGESLRPTAVRHVWNFADWFNARDLVFAVTAMIFCASLTALFLCAVR